jgi:uncharacterized repeat protein (TIGR02543 family)
MIFNPAEGGALKVSWAAHSGAKGEDWDIGDDDPVTPGNQNQDGSGRTRKITAGVTGVVTSVGGPYNEVVIKIDNDPLGRSRRSCEHAVIRVAKGDHIIDAFRVVGEGALFRKDSFFPNGSYRFLHLNGFDSRGNRIPDSGMVTHTQTQVKEAMTVEPSERMANATGSNARTLPTTVGTTIVPPASISKNTSAFFDGWITGSDPYGTGNTNWFSRIFNGVRYFYHSSGFTDAGTHDLKNLNTYSVLFDTEDGVPEDYILKTFVGDPIGKPAEDPTKENFTFAGWVDSNGTEWNFATPVPGNLTLFAKWTPVPNSGNAPTIEEIKEALQPQFDEIKELIRNQKFNVTSTGTAVQETPVQ